MTVADTGPLIRLEELRAWHLLELIAPVIVPAEVAIECKRPIVPLESEFLRVEMLAAPSASFRRIQSAIESGLIARAEGESIAWCLSEPSSLLLTDDAAARALAEALEIEVRGSLGILLANAALGTIKRSDADDLLARMAGSSLWVSPRVVDAAREMLSQIDDANED